MWDSIMDALGYLGSSLDKPGRAVRGLLSGNTREGLSAVPFSDSMGLTDESQRTSGKDLLNSLGAGSEGTMGDLAGFGAELATDPLMYAGAGLGRMLGRNAESAAVARGPRYGTTAEDLQGMMGKFAAGGGDAETAAYRTKDLLGSPDAARVLSEINPQSQVLGLGAEGVAFQNPAGNVTRVGRVPLGEAGRPVSDNVLQATSAIDIPGLKGAQRVERMPLAEGVGDAARVGSPAELDAAMSREGLGFGDRKAENMGLVGGRPKVIDPGAVDVLPEFAGGFQPVGQARDPSRPMNALLDALGGDQAMRSALDSGLSSPDLRRKLIGYGAFGGADLGAWGRTQTGR